MPPNNPMTEGEALAVDYSTLARDVARTLQKAGAPLTEDQILLLAGSLAVYVEAALTAHTAASGGEGQPECVCCEDCGTEVEAYCPKCAPPAAVPADALERLVAEWLTRVRRNDGEAESMRQNTYEQCADELAALIPKGADHEQR